MGFDIFRNNSLIAHVAPTIVSYSDNTENLETGDYKYCVVPVYPFSCTFEDKCFEEYINNVGIKNYSSALQLYPNPAYNIVNIEGEAIANVKIYNNMGQRIKSYNNVNSVNVASYHAGIYFFNISTINGDVGVYKVIVSK